MSISTPVGVMKMIEVPDLEFGEVGLKRDPGGPLILSVRSPLIAEFNERTFKKSGQSAYLGTSFPAWSVKGIESRFTAPQRYSLLSASNPSGDDVTGNGPPIPFLLHTEIGQGFKMEINYPVNPQTLADQIGDAISIFVEEHLAPFKAGLKFFFLRA